jgi:hypothetical protein
MYYGQGAMLLPYASTPNQCHNYLVPMPGAARLPPDRPGALGESYLLKVSGGGVMFCLNGATYSVLALRSKLIRSTPRSTSSW